MRRTMCARAAPRRPIPRTDARLRRWKVREGRPTMSLTGRFDFQITFTGKLLLLVEEEVPKMFKRGKGSQTMRKRWRPAKAIDLSVPAMRPLIDLRGAAGKRPFSPQL